MSKISNWVDQIVNEDGDRLSAGSLGTLQLIKNEAFKVEEQLKQVRKDMDQVRIDKNLVVQLYDSAILENQQAAHLIEELTSQLKLKALGYAQMVLEIQQLSKQIAEYLNKDKV